MRKGRSLWAAGIFLAVLALAGPAFAETVTVKGQAPIVEGNLDLAKKAALSLALRSAVEQGLGTLIDARTQVANYEVIQDRIFSRASGYVTRYDIVSEETAPDGSLYTVTVKAEVQTASIKDDLRAIGVLMSQAGNPRFMAIYLPETRSSAFRDSRVVQAAGQAISGVFARKGFVVLDRAFVSDVYDEIERAGRVDVDMEDLSALALKYKADLLLVYDVSATPKAGGASRYFGGVLVEMSLRAVAGATADLIAQKRGDGYARTLKGEGESYDDAQAAKMADEVAKAVSEALVEDVLAYFERSVQAGARYDLWFRNFSEKEAFAIVDVLDTLTGVSDKNVRNQSPGNFQLDINFQGKMLDFQQALYKALLDKGIAFSTQQAKGNRLLIYKKGTDNPFGKPEVR